MNCIFLNKFTYTNARLSYWYCSKNVSGCRRRPDLLLLIQQ